MTRRHNKTKNDSLKTVEELFKLHAVDDVDPRKLTILKNYSVSFSEIENNVLQSWKVSASHGIVMHFQSQRFFVVSISKLRTQKIVYKNISRLRHSCFTQIPWVMSSMMAQLY